LLSEGFKGRALTAGAADQLHPGARSITFAIWILDDLICKSRKLFMVMMAIAAVMVLVILAKLSASPGILKIKRFSFSIPENVKIKMDPFHSAKRILKKKGGKSQEKW